MSTSAPAQTVKVRLGTATPGGGFPVYGEAFVAAVRAQDPELEIEVLGDWAWIRNHLEVSVTPPDNEANRRSGYTLTVLRKGTDGRWRLFRDANLLS